MSIHEPCHVVAVFGGACAGSVAAEYLATRGVRVVVYEQNPRPYGKIEDGLPRWHKQQRAMEYRKIDQRLATAGITFVPSTGLGRDIDFADTVGWGWSAVLLANGAWKDRPLDLEGADALLGHGLAYQNPFVYWFNHANERTYDGPRFDIPQAPVCVGGGLASIDVIKIFQLELYGRALAERGVSITMHELEHQGIPKVCEAHGLGDPRSLGVGDAVLVYRRRVEDMPLASPPDGATEAQRQKIEAVRRKILDKARDKYLFEVRAQTSPVGLVVEGGRVAGLRLVRNTVEGGKARPEPGSEHELRTTFVVSSIGSIPEPLPGVAMRGTVYDLTDEATGAYRPVPGVFGVGNVVTGKGNIVASVTHGRQVAAHVAEAYLGVGEPGERDVSGGLRAAAEAHGAAAGERVATHLARVAPLAPVHAQALLERAAGRQRDLGYREYRAWIEQVTPPDAE